MALKYPVLIRRYPTNIIPSIPVIEGQMILELAQDNNGKIFLDSQGIRRVIGGSYLSTYEVTFPASGWSASAPFTQTVNVSGVTQYDTAVPTLNQGSATSEASQRNLQLNFNYILWYDINDNSITATAPFTKPTMDLKVNFVGQ
jgi:hypothetical protein